jgi:transposase
MTAMIFGRGAAAAGGASRPHHCRASPRLERQLDRLLARKPTDAQGRKLRDAVALDCRDKLFVFLKRRDAEPTNNESERALRPSVIFRR